MSYPDPKPPWPARGREWAEREIGPCKANKLGTRQCESHDPFIGNDHVSQESNGVDPEHIKGSSGGSLIFYQNNDWDERTFASTVKSRSEPDIEAQRNCYLRVPHNDILTRMVMPDIPSTLGDRASTFSPPSPTATPTKSNSSSQLEADLGRRQLSPKNPEMSNKGQDQSPSRDVEMEHQDHPPIGSVTDSLWQHIQRLRVDTWSTRSRVHRLRAVLREKQHAKSEADDLLFKSINKQLLLNLNSKPECVIPGGKTIADLMQECQNTRDDYGPIEDDCNQLEDELSAQEFRLTRMEEDFYGHSNEAPVLNVDDDTKIVTLAEREQTVSLESLENIEFHPLVKAFLSRLGDLDLLRESLDELIEERESLEEERSSRERAGESLDKNDQLWLDNYQTEKDSMAREIGSAENEVEAMRKDCISRGLINENDEPTDFLRQEQVSFSGEQNLNSKNESSEYVKYPLLLPHPGIKQSSLEVYNPKPDDDSECATTRINEWMLDRLRTSPLDVRLLASTFEVSYGQIDDRWQDSVLSVWYHDGTFKGQTGIRVYTGSMTTRASPPRESTTLLETHKDYKIDGGYIISSPRDPSERSDTTQIAAIFGSVSIS